MTDERQIVAALVKIRKRRGMTQRDVAEKMHVTQSDIGEFERAHYHGRSLTMARLLRYAAAIGADLLVADPEARTIVTREAIEPQRPNIVELIQRRQAGLS